MKRGRVAMKESGKAMSWAEKEGDDAIVTDKSVLPLQFCMVSIDAALVRSTDYELS